MVTQLEDGQAPGRPNYWLIPPNVRPLGITYGTASRSRVTENFYGVYRTFNPRAGSHRPQFLGPLLIRYSRTVWAKTTKTPRLNSGGTTGTPILEIPLQMVWCRANKFCTATKLGKWNLLWGTSPLNPEGRTKPIPKYREKARFYGVDHASLKQTPLGTCIPCLKKSQTRDIFGHNFIKTALISIMLGAEDLYSVLD